ncbi:acetoin dehydrogenase dihydrolipoyllysine-residue acetyltransferase subunit [Hoeflea ulvae]|uniref:Acetoin dehydrogenase dihydrolipoyllysine-residue acetyltransferase subunit n=1 Tax=Hoeflea ulvae TaxID=2983764 RepID=A0ABT3YEL9_9HYPH|nr:acetoin dehydrogenase dihydrolipoyllysine-residue acetyltransferase subunit [Hoeflea ulvae]MCY0094257.1 acetoin dehydrogenase dihydrolipoyllysine-residue acetyltransferase subunit [Hoeflea ulvae]
MPVEVIMPKVDMDMASGKITVWHVAAGDKVGQGDPLFDIETDKAAMEVEASAGGYLHHLVAEGTDVPIGQPVAWIYAEGEDVGPPPQTDAPSPEGPAPEVGPDPAASAPAPADTAAALETHAKTRATPLARSLARKAGIEIGDVTGSGPRGRVQAEDVRATQEQTQPAPAAAPPGFTAETGPLAVSRSKGGTGTPVVLIHGFASDAKSWAPLEAHISDHPIIRIELPAHGKSPRLGISRFADLVSEVRRAFDMLGLESAHLVGHSLGGAVTLALADTRPKTVSSLTLLAPAGLGPDINGAALTGIGKATRAESLGPWLKQMVADERLITDGYVRAAMAARADTAMRNAQNALADAVFPDGVQAFDMRSALDRVDMPARIVWGRQDRIIPWQHALRAPGRVSLHLFDNVGHLPQFEISGEVGKLLRAHL